MEERRPEEKKQKRQRPWRPPSPETLRWEVVEGPTETPEEWTASILTTVHDRWGHGLPGTKLNVILGTEKVSEEITDGTGNAIVEIRGLTPEKNRVTVQVADRPKLQVTKPISIPKPTPSKIPAKLLVEVTGDGGEYELSAFVRAADGRCVPGAVIEVIEVEGEEAKPRIRRLKTDSKGARLRRYSFKNRERDITIRVLGGTEDKDLVWSRRLYGPRPKSPEKGAENVPSGA